MTMQQVMDMMQELQEAMAALKVEQERMQAFYRQVTVGHNHL